MGKCGPALPSTGMTAATLQRHQATRSLSAQHCRWAVGSFERRYRAFPVVLDIRDQAGVLQSCAALGKMFPRHPVDWCEPLGLPS